MNAYLPPAFKDNVNHHKSTGEIPVTESGQFVDAGFIDREYDRINRNFGAPAKKSNEKPGRKLV